MTLTQHTKRIFLTLLITLPIAGFSGKSPLAKAMKKGNYALSIGEHRVAIKNFTQITGSLRPQNNQEILTKATALIRLGRAHARYSGRYSDFEPYLKDATTLLDKSFKESPQYVTLNCDIVDIYLDLGDLNHAQDIIGKLKQVTNRLKNNQPGISQIEIKEARLEMLKGNFDDAMLLAKNSSSYLAKKITPTYDVVSDGKTKKKKYKKIDFEDLKRNYTRHLNFIGEISISQGNYSQAKKDLDIAANWIEENIRKGDITYVDNLALQAKVMYELNRLNKAISLLKEAITVNNSLSSKRKYFDASFPYIEMNRLYIEYLIKRDRSLSLSSSDKSEVRTRRNNLHVVLNNTAYYKENSFIKVYETLLLSEMELWEKDYDKAERKMNEVMTETIAEFFVEDHPFKIVIAEAAANTFMATEYLQGINLANNLLHEQTDLYIPKSCPVYHKKQIDKAIYYSQYANKFDEANTIYSESWDKVVSKIWHPHHPDYLKFINARTELFLRQESLSEAEKNIESSLILVDKYFNKKTGMKNYRYAKQLNEKIKLFIYTGKYLDAKKEISTLLKKGSGFFEVNKNDVNKQMQDEVEGQIYRSWVLLDIAQTNYEGIKDHLRNYRNKTSIDRDNKKDILAFAPYYISDGKLSFVRKILKKYLTQITENYGDQDRRLAPVYLHLAKIDLEQGIYNEAEKKTHNARTILLNVYGSKTLVFSKYLHIQGDIDLALGDYAGAIDNYRQTLETQTELLGKDHLLNARVLSTLALTELYDAEGRLTKKLQQEIEAQLLESADMIKRLLGRNETLILRSADYLEILQKEAIFYLSIGDNPKAMEKIQLARMAWQKTNVRSDQKEAELAVLIGRIHMMEGRHGKAMGEFLNAENTYRSLYGENHPDFVEVLGYKGQVYYMQGRIPDALALLDRTTEAYMTYVDKYFAYLSERDKREFWFKKLQPEFEFYKTLAFQNPNSRLSKKVYNHILSTKALLLSSSLKVRDKIATSGDPDLINKYEEWIEKKEMLTSALSMTAIQLKEEGIDLETLQGDVQAIEKNLSETSEAFKESNKRQTYDWKTIKSVLKENEYAVEIIRYRYFNTDFSDSIVYKALIINEKSSSPQVVDIPDGNMLENKYKKFYRNAIKYKIADKQSYDKFWKQIHEVVGDNSVIFLSPDGVFNEINLEAIPTPDGGYVIDKNDIRILSNTKDLAVARMNQGIEEEMARTAFLLGNPSYYSANLDNPDHSNTSKYQKIKQLPGAEEEIQLVEELFNADGWDVTTLLYADATEEAIKNISNSPEIIHIATHGFFDKNIKSKNDISSQIDRNKPQANPLLRSGLILSNGGEIVEENKIEQVNIRSGVLTAYEAMNLNLDNTKLVVLSACETGLGETQTGEGVFGLQRAFIVAGADNVIMSLFKVNDAVTKELMGEFYANWIKTHDKRQALIDAKKEIRVKYPDPIYWGSFVMIGK